MSEHIENLIIELKKSNLYYNVFCNSCHCVLTKDNFYNANFLYSRTVICNDCASKYKKCDACGDIILGDVIEVDDSHMTICFNCFRNLGGFQCKCCNHYCLRGENITLYGKVCIKCFEKSNCFKCHQCCKRYMPDRYGIDGYCITCANEKIVNCQNYTFKPCPNFYNYNGEHDELYMGIELEAGKCDTSEKVINFIENNKNGFFYMKRDASIPAYGCEIVTHPATLKYHENKASWNKILNEARQIGLNSDNDKCGIHIHLNKNFFNSYEIQLIDCFINKEHRFWEQISRRMSTYSAYINKDRSHWGIQTTDRHCALNLSNQYTIELRIFKGTLDYSVLLSYLQITNSLAYFIKELSQQKDILAKLSSDNKFDSQNEFLSFINKRKFKCLDNYLNEIFNKNKEKELKSELF